MHATFNRLSFFTFSPFQTPWTTNSSPSTRTWPTPALAAFAKPPPDATSRFCANQCGLLLVSRPFWADVGRCVLDGESSILKVSSVKCFYVNIPIEYRRFTNRIVRLFFVISKYRTESKFGTKPMKILHDMIFWRSSNNLSKIYASVERKAYSPCFIHDLIIFQ